MLLVKLIHLCLDSPFSVLWNLDDNCKLKGKCCNKSHSEGCETGASDFSSVIESIYCSFRQNQHFWKTRRDIVVTENLKICSP